MDENFSPVKGTKHDPSLSRVKKKLLLVVNDNKNHAVKQLFYEWSRDTPHGRNLAPFNPVRLNTGALLLDDTEYTRGLCMYYNARRRGEIEYFLVEPLFDES